MAYIDFPTNNAEFAGAVNLATGETLADSIAQHFLPGTVHSIEPTHAGHGEGYGPCHCDDPDLEFTHRGQDFFEQRWRWHSADGSMERLS